MSTLRAAWARLVSFFRKDALDRELDEELAAHIELATEDHMRQGMSVREDRRVALIKLGGVEQFKEVHRASRGLPWLDGVLQDVRAAVRTLRRNRGFTVVAVAMLALGIGVNTAVFTVTNAMLFKGMPGVDPEGRLLYLDSRNSSGGGGLSYPDFEDWRAQTRSFVDLAVVSSGGLRLRFGDQNGLPDTYDATQLSTNAFQVLGQRPILGRHFVSSDEAPGATPVTILSYHLWTDRYGENPAIVGQTVRIDDVPTVVIGVMAQGFRFPHHRVDLWLPLVPTRTPLDFRLPEPELFQKRERRFLYFAFGRLADGVTLESARTEMEGR